MAALPASVEGQPMPSGSAHVRFDPKHTHVTARLHKPDDEFLHDCPPFSSRTGRILLHRQLGL
jgi:hypothetical protein